MKFNMNDLSTEDQVMLRNLYRAGLDQNFPKKQTPELCLDAVRRNWSTIRFVEDKTEEICLEAVRQLGRALYYIGNQTPAVCMAAVQNDGMALEFATAQTPEICVAALKQNPYSISYAKCFSEEWYKLAAEIFEAPEDFSNYEWSYHFNNEYENSDRYDYSEYPAWYVYADEEHYDLRKFFASRWVPGEYLASMKNPSIELCIAAVQNCPFAIQWVQHQTPEMCLRAVSYDGMLLKHVKEQTLDICIVAVKRDKRALELVHPDLYDAVVEAVSAPPPCPFTTLGTMKLD